MIRLGHCCLWLVYSSSRALTKIPKLPRIQADQPLRVIEQGTLAPPRELAWRSSLLSRVRIERRTRYIQTSENSASRWLLNAARQVDARQERRNHEKARRNRAGGACWMDDCWSLRCGAARRVRADF